MALNSVNDYINANLTHSIHTSERRSFRGCRRRWDWISRQFYYPKVTPRPLEFGVAFHAAMEAAYLNRLGLFVDPDPGATLAIALAVFKRVTKEQRQKYILLNGGIDEVLDLDYRDRVEQGVGMLKYYFGKLYPDVDKGLKPIKVEIKFEVPISNPETGVQDLWCKCDWCWRRWARSKEGTEHHDKWQERIEGSDGPGIGGGNEAFYRGQVWKGLPVTYGGRLDILWEDTEGKYWIGDWKTAMRLSDLEGPDEYLWNDDQITAYVWALRLIGIRVEGFIYMELKKAVPEEPEPMKTIRLGRRFSVSKNLSTTAELYEQTVKENDPGAWSLGLYTEFIDYLKENAPQFHHREYVMRNDEECRQAGINIWKEAKEMTNPDLLIYPSQGRFHCKGMTPNSGCAFWDPCLGVNRGEDYRYTLDTMYQKLDRHYWETAEPTTDKRMEAL